VDKYDVKVKRISMQGSFSVNNSIRPFSIKSLSVNEFMPNLKKPSDDIIP